MPILRKSSRIDQKHVFKMATRHLLPIIFLIFAKLSNFERISDRKTLLYPDKPQIRPPAEAQGRSEDLPDHRF